MRLDRRTAIAGALLPMAFLCAPLPAAAQSFPDRPIKLIVPFGAGSAVDTIARAIAAQVAEHARKRGEARAGRVARVPPPGGVG